MMRKTAATRDGQTTVGSAAAPAIVPLVNDDRDLVNHAIVAVQSEWNDWRSAHVRVTDLEDVHWAQPPGARQPLVHGAVWCNRLHSGHLSHDCELTPAPHRLVVCVLKSHTQPAVFAELARRADAAAGGAPFAR
jgi:hypothetical protein